MYYPDYAVRKRDEKSEILYEAVRRAQRRNERYSNAVCHFGILWVHTFW